MSNPHYQGFIDHDFSSESEEWSYYQIDDGSKLKVKLILTRFLINKDIKQFRFKHKLVLEILEVPEKLFGSPGTSYNSPQVVEQSIIARDLPFKLIGGGDWNIYNVVNGMKIKVKNDVMDVNRTSLHDEYGEPIYSIQNTQQYSIAAPKKNKSRKDS